MYLSYQIYLQNDTYQCRWSMRVSSIGLYWHVAETCSALRGLAREHHSCLANLTPCTGIAGCGCVDRAFPYLLHYLEEKQQQMKDTVKLSGVSIFHSTIQFKNVQNLLEDRP